MQALCSIFGVSRQAYYKRQKSIVRRMLADSSVLAEVREIRRGQPNIGGRKLQVKVKERGFQMGRDRMFQLLRNHHLLVRPRKKHVRTTYSSHWFRKYRNLIKDLEINRPNQVLVSDITYLDTNESFCYLALVTDVCSRKIVGFDVSTSLAVEGALRAVKMALKGIDETNGLIHHSDRGIQYCCHAYTKTLKRRKVRISMTEENHVYENAIAERVNGILKTEFMLGEKLQSFKVAKELVKQSIKTYNEQRPHMSLNYQTPESQYNLAA